MGWWERTMADGIGSVERRALEFLRATRRVLHEACESSTLDASILEMVPRDEDLNSPPEVCVVGTFSAGKSSLINAIIGADLAPADPRPSSVRPTRFRGGAVQVVRLRSRSGEVRETSLERYQWLVNKLSALTPADREELATLELAEIQYGSTALGRITLMDTPGFGDGQKDVDDAATERYLDNAAALVWVFDINRADPTAAELERIRKFGGSSRMRFAVLAKADCKPPSERAAVQEAFRRLRVFDDVFVFSADLRRKANRGESLRQGELAGLTQSLEEKLLGHVARRAAELQARRITEQCRNLLAAATAELAEDWRSLDATRAAYDTELTRIRSTADKIGGRLATKVVAEIERIRDEIVRKYSGQLANAITLDEGIFSTDVTCYRADVVSVFSDIIDEAQKIPAELAAVVEEAILSLVHPIQDSQRRVMRTMRDPHDASNESEPPGPDDNADTIAYLALIEPVKSAAYTIVGAAVAAGRIFPSVDDGIMVAFKKASRQERRNWFDDWLGIDIAIEVVRQGLCFEQSSEDGASPAQYRLRLAAELHLGECGGWQAEDMVTACRTAMADIERVQSSFRNRFN